MDKRDDLEKRVWRLVVEVSLIGTLLGASFASQGCLYIPYKYKWGRRYDGAEESRQYQQQEKKMRKADDGYLLK